VCAKVFSNAGAAGARGLQFGLFLKLMFAAFSVESVAHCGDPIG